MSHSLIIQFRSVICQVVAYRRLKTKENFKLLALKVVMVINERCSHTRGSKQKDLTWKLLVFQENWSLRRGGRLREVIPTGGSTVHVKQHTFFKSPRLCKPVDEEFVGGL